MYQVIQLNVSQGPFKNYTYLIVDAASQTAAIVDPAWNSALVEQQLSAAKARLTMILLTHAHFDHVNLVDELVERHPLARVFISRREAEFYGFQSQRLEWLEHQSQLDLGASRINALLTPGHTAGGMCYQFAGDLFTGDTLFVEGCGICDQPGGSATEMYHSLQLIRQLVPPHTKVYPGHSYGKTPGTSLAEILESNIYFHFEKIEDFVRFRMRHSDLDPLGFR
jgi:hydroxyacylglutathione hydrolase